MQAVFSSLNSILYKPDNEAFKLILCAAISHFLKPLNLPPVWLMILGRSGSGKSEMIQALADIPHVTAVSSVTSKTFFSGFRRQNGPGSFMQRLGSDALITFKDFGSITSLRYDDMKEILAQLREIWDGSYNRPTGSHDDISWKGRTTLICAATPDFEKERLAHRSLGERFFDVWPLAPDDKELSQFLLNRGQKPDAAILKQEVAKFITSLYLTDVEIPQTYKDEISELADRVAILRTAVERDFKGHEIVDIKSKESPTRLAQAFLSILVSASLLYKHSIAGEEEIALVRRLAHDSVPRLRNLALENKERPKKDPLTGSPLSEWAWRCAKEELREMGLL